jgi:predicted MFS family arabinose efflux permease
MTGHFKRKNRGNPAVKTSSTAVHEFLPLLWLALGTFATGAESFMIAALLPGLAGDLSVSITTAGQLMTVFALVYALSSPLLATATGAMSRRKVLLLSMAAFALFNFVAAAAVNYWQLMAARILLACAAGLYVPSASALAGAVVSPQRRGTALAIVTGGSSVAVALGVPLGAVIGHAMGWRMTFVSVGILASLAVTGLLFGFPHRVGAALATPTLRERLAVVQQPPVLVALLATVIWGAGACTLYSYLAPYLTRVAGIEGSQVSLMLFIWGCAAVTGLFTGGAINDRLGARAMIVPALALLGLAFASLSIVPDLLTGKILLACIAAAIVVWGVAGWGFFPAQQARLIGIAGVKVAPIVLSPNASSMYLGFSLGAALGSITR